MKLEHIANGSLDTPLIRLYNFDEAAAVMLDKIAAELKSGAATTCDSMSSTGLSLSTVVA